jgi:hypothetical protein
MPVSALADRASTFLGATSVETDLVDPKFDFVRLSRSVDANLELFDLVLQRVQTDILAMPVWRGQVFTGAAELGALFKTV